jgi:hypothetical protein
MTSSVSAPVGKPRVSTSRAVGSPVGARSWTSRSSPGGVPDHQHSFDVVAHLSAAFEPGLPTGAVQLVVGGDLHVVGERGPHPLQRGDGTHRRGAPHHLDVGSTFLERTSEP